MKKVLNIFILTTSIIVILLELYFLIIFGTLFLFNPQSSKTDQYRAKLINTTSQKKLNEIQNFNSFSFFLRAENLDSVKYYFDKMDSEYKMNNLLLNDTILKNKSFL
jgi:Tfp pilus assembly protein PilO